MNKQYKCDFSTPIVEDKICDNDLDQRNHRYIVINCDTSLGKVGDRQIFRFQWEKISKRAEIKILGSGFSEIYVPLKEGSKNSISITLKKVYFRNEDRTGRDTSRVGVWVDDEIS